MPGAPDDPAELELLRARLADAAHQLARAEQLRIAGRRIAAELDHRRVPQVVIEAATSLVGAEHGAMFYRATDDHGEQRLLHACAGPARAAFAEMPPPRATALLGPLLRGDAIVRIADVLRESSYGKNAPHRGVPDGHPVMRSVLGVPVGMPGRPPIGALLFGDSRVDAFDGASEDIARELAEHAATAMDHAHRYDEAQRVIAQLQTANAELDQFSYAASHDLRAPLRGIANLATWIDEDLPTSTDPQTKEHLRLLRARAARMDRLLSGLLELARIGRSQRTVERVELSELVHEAIVQCNPGAQARVMMVGELPTLFSERAALHQVFMHLISNALQHAGRDDVNVRIAAREHGDEWELSVADNGAGIAPEHRARVWQLFQTLQRERGDAINAGIGVGLTIVRKQVERNGGRAWIDPDASGTTVRFTWPKRTRA